jgi:hypothetical protein
VTTGNAGTSGDPESGTAPSSDAPAPVGPPLLRVVKGEPTAEELAALVAVIAARSGGAGDDVGSGPRSAWTDRSRYVRRPLTPGPGAWTASALPH